ncbi:penicillin acylase family protein [Streptomyces candidus]|uniref:Acyl-homoserine-lactone acylase n=1 Tax=Streptomyces candidus TaxID=67283 RepID=A0A7X0HK92_9ACTN|nr:penicillin acylase family protein [Streptomyces candidus]MBB6437932.1 acyl-homoserine-lactone acylase [Streptomyces candidus]GHH49679.1 penicillin amidase [Streptomyces candidus]
MSLRPRARSLAVTAVVLLTAAGTLAPAASAVPGGQAGRPSGGGLSALVRYTEYGIPHILAKDYANLGFGTGWAQANDQVCTLAEGFVTVRAERSRHFGAEGAPDGALSSASTNLASDLYFQGVRDSGTVAKVVARPAPAGPSRQARELMRGWTAGYNAWLKQNKVTDPACKDAPWVQAVSLEDVHTRNYALSVLGGQGRAVDGITGAQPPAKTPARASGTAGGAADPAEAARRLFDTSDATMGSNAVAFSGSTTADRRGLLLGNPHYPWAGGRRFWQSQQTIPGELNVSGGSLLGSATVSIGHNPHVAWSHTVATGVPMNLHQLTLDPSDPTVYLVDGARERMTKRTVTVPVKGGRAVTRTQWWSRYGPVVTGLGAQLPLPWTATAAYALNDPNATNMRAADTALGFSKARSVAGIQDVLRRTQGLPWVNTIASDSSGGSLFTQSQVLPRITDGLAQRCSTPLGRVTYPASGMAILDGSRGDCAPGRDKDAVEAGIFGPSRMPTLRDAPYAVNSNDSAWLANADRPLTGYERVFGNIGTPRSLRTRGGIEDVAAMAKRGRLTVADLQKQQFANRVPAADLVLPDLLKVCAGPELAGACAALRAWDRKMDTGSRGALLFDRFWRKLVVAVPAERRWKAAFDPADPVRTPRALDTGDPGVASSLAAAVAELTAAGIALDAPLGDNQFVVRNGKRIPLHGGTESLGVWNKIEPVWNAAGGGYKEVTTGTSYVQAVGWNGTRCPVARTLLTYGQSSNPHSPYFSDQTELYSGEKWVTSRFCEGDILRSPKLKVVWARDRR